MDMAKLAELAEQQNLLHEQSLLSVLDSLREIDPEIVARLIAIFGERTRAAEWLVRPVRSLGHIAPIKVLAEGRRTDVLCVLDQISHGVYA